jgi:uncharacterized membrane protein
LPAKYRKRKSVGIANHGATIANEINHMIVATPNTNMTMSKMLKKAKATEQDTKEVIALNISVLLYLYTVYSGGLTRCQPATV